MLRDKKMKIKLKEREKKFTLIQRDFRGVIIIISGKGKNERKTSKLLARNS